MRFTRLRSEKMKYPEYVPVFSVVSTISTVNSGSTGRIRKFSEQIVENFTDK